MYTIKVNDKAPSAASVEKENTFIIEGKEIRPDIIEIRNGLFHIIIGTRSFNAEIIDHNRETKTFRIRVNNNVYKIEVSDRYDALLKELGMDSLSAHKAADLKAPMPGLVVNVEVNEGDEVKKGDKLLVLEAMKMENILKATADGIIKKVKVQKGNTVEKNEILILFN